MNRSRALAVSLTAVLLTPLAAQTPRLMTFDDVMGVVTVNDAQVSPDGTMVAYVANAVDLKENAVNADIWLAAVDGGRSVRLTTSPKADNQPRWSPDGRTLAFVSAREEKPQLFLISPTGGEAERVTTSKTGVQGFQWSPDGKQIAFLAEQEPTAEEERRLKDKDDVQLVDRDFKYRHLWLLDVASREAREIVGGDVHAGDPQWSPDGRSIAYVTAPTPKADDGTVTDVWIVEVGTGAKRKLLDNPGPDSAPRWSPDGSRIALLSRAGREGALGQARLVTIAAAGGAPADVARTLQYEPGAPRWSSDGRTLYFTAQTGTRSQLFAVPAAGGEARPATAVEGVINSFSIASNGTLAFTMSSLQVPPAVYASKGLAPVRATRLSDHNSALGQVALGRSEVVRWKSKDGLEVEGLVVYPVGYEPGRRYPLIVQVHGGPSGVWADAFPASWNNYGHVWAGRGWVSFYPNPRGSTGYGEKFLLANVRDWGGGDYQDIQTGIDALIARGVADPNRLGQTGWSYGGYMTAWTLTQTTRFKAVMVGAGLTNMFSMYSTNDLQRVLDGYFGAEPWDDTELYWTRSAMNFIKQARTPTLIMHGAADQRVPISQAQELYMGLRKNEVGVEMAVYPREPHGLQEPRHQLDKMTREYAWFEKHVLGSGTTSPEGAVKY